MEAATYRLHIEQLNMRFGGKAMLTAKEACEYLGHSPLWCRKHLGIDKNGVTVVGLAHKLASRDKH